jgi:hypothetical protein
MDNLLSYCGLVDARISDSENDLPVWQYGLWSFQTGDTKLERLLPKNQLTQRKILNFEF